MVALNKNEMKDAEEIAGVKIEQTDVTHIIRTHTEGKNCGHISTLELSEDKTKWFIQTVNGNLVQLEDYRNLDRMEME